MVSIIRGQKLSMKKYVLLGIDFLIVFAALAGFYAFSFGADTLTQFINPMINIDAALTYGRYMYYFLTRSLYSFGILLTDYYKFSWAVFVVCVTLYIYLTQISFLPYLKLNNLMKLGFIFITSILVVNGLCCEFLMFPEMFVVFGMAFLNAGLSIYFYSKKKYFFFIFFAVFGCMFYQTSLITMAIVIAAFIYIEGGYRITGKLFIREFVSIAALMLIGVVNILSTSVLKHIGIIEDSTRSIDTAGFKNRLFIMIHDYKVLLSSGLWLMPKLYLPLILTILPFIFVIMYGVKNKDYAAIGEYIFIYIILSILAFALNMMEDTQTGMTPRLVYNFYTVQVAMILIAIKYICEFDYGTNVLCLFTGIYLMAQLFSCTMISQNRRLSNQIDLMNAKVIVDAIEDYENKTGNKIKYIATYQDSVYTQSYPNVHYHVGAINEKTLGLVTYSLIRYVSGNDNLKKADSDMAIYDEYFKDKDWDCLVPDEQMVFIGDTLHYVAY